MVNMYKSKKKASSSNINYQNSYISNNKEKIKAFNLENLTKNLQLAFVSKNIEVKVSSRNNILEIILEGNNKLNQKDCLQTIQKQLFPLNSSHRFAKIYGTNSNNKLERWVKEINLKNCCPQCSDRVTYIFRSKQFNLKFCKSCKWPINNAFDTADTLANKAFQVYRTWEKNSIDWYLSVFKKRKKNPKKLFLIVGIPLIALSLVFGISWKFNYQPAYQVSYDANAPSQYFLYKQIETRGDRPTLLWKRPEGVCLYISHYSGFDREKFAEQIKQEYAVKCVNYLD